MRLAATSERRAGSGPYGFKPDGDVRSFPSFAGLTRESIGSARIPASFYGPYGFKPDGDVRSFPSFAGLTRESIGSVRTWNKRIRAWSICDLGDF